MVCHEIKFDNCVKNKITLLLNIFFFKQKICYFKCCIWVIFCVIQHSCMTLTEELFRSSFELLTETHVLGSNYPFKSAMQKFSE